MKNVFLGLLLCVAVAGGVFAANSKLYHADQAVSIMNSPLSSNPDATGGTVGTTPAIGVANCGVATAASLQWLQITNLHASQYLCWYLVAAGSACGTGQDCTIDGTTDANVIQPGQVKEFTATCSFRLCLVGSAASTSYAVSRAEVRK